MRIHGDVADVLRFRVAGHLEHQRIVGVQHRTVGGDFDDDALQLAELLESVDALEPQMIGLHVEYRADVDLGDAHAGAQQPAARGFEHRDIDLRIRQHHARGHRSRHVARHRTLAIDVDAIRGRQSRRIAGHFGEVRQHARRGGLAVGAGDGRDRHAHRSARREQHVDDRRGDIAGVPSLGATCMRNPGAALTSQMPPPMVR